MLGAHIAEADGGLGLLAAAFDIDDHTFAERGVLHVVADAQPDLLGIGLLWRQPLARGQRGIDHSFAMGDSGLAALRIVAVTTSPAVLTAAVRGAVLVAARVVAVAVALTT